MNPAMLLAMVPSLANLFGGGPNLPQYNAQQLQSLISQLYGNALGGAQGQGMMNQANLAGNQFSGALNANLARTGMSSSGLGAVAGAGGQSVAGLGRMQVQSDLAQQANQQAFQLMQGQMQGGMFNAMHPHGFTSFAGNLGASLYPLLAAGGGGGKTASFGAPGAGGMNGGMPNINGSSYYNPASWWMQNGGGV